jgi:PTH1 family peptidyl-tRNA hydrolase
VYAIIGLGNPGRRYINTRHNIGYAILDHLSGINNVPFKAGKGDYYYADFTLKENRLLLVKPTTYMNRSGEAVKHVLRYFPVRLNELLVIYDDFNLPFGTIRFRPQGSDGGHNGMRSVIYQLETDTFHRLRFGIGDSFNDAVQHVLAKFSEEEMPHLSKLIEICRDGVESWIEYGIEKTMSTYNNSYLEDNTNR